MYIIGDKAWCSFFNDFAFVCTLDVLDGLVSLGVLDGFEVCDDLKVLDGLKAINGLEALNHLKALNGLEALPPRYDFIKRISQNWYILRSTCSIGSTPQCI